MISESLDPKPETRNPKPVFRLLRNPRSFAALTIVLIMLAIALTANFIAPFGYAAQDRGHEHATPNAQHWMGTDFHGRDILSRLMFGAQISMLVGILSTTVSLLIGTYIGLLAGYFGGKLEAVLMRFTDTVAAFPSLLLAVAIAVLNENKIMTVAESVQILVFALGIVGWPALARIVRSQVLTIKTLDYVASARALGASNGRIIFRYVLPNCISPLIVVTTLAIGGNILGEAGLSFLGLGVQDPFPSWGGMLSDAKDSFQTHWWVAVFPGLAIVLTVLSFNLLGDGLRDALDPKSNRAS